MWRVLLPNPFCLPELLPEGTSEVSKPGTGFYLLFFVKEEQQTPGSDSKESEGKEQLFWTDGGDTSTVST